MNKIATIDLEGIDPDFPDVNSDKFLKIVREFDKGLIDFGFLYIKNHGLSKDTIDRVLNSSKNFFISDLYIKMKYIRKEDANNFLGYKPMGYEKLADGQFLYEKEDVNESVSNSIELREMFDVHGKRDEISYPSSSDAPDLKDSLVQIEKEFNKLSKIIFKLLATAMGLDDIEFFTKTHQGLENLKGNNTTLRTCYYPKVTDDNIELNENSIRCGIHTDYGTLTLLIQNSGGLEIKTSNDEWIKMEAIEGNIICNTADLLEYVSGGRYKAGYHRVLVPSNELENKDRQSIVYFMNPDIGSKFSPVLPLTQNFRFLKFKEIDTYEYFWKRIDYSILE